MSTSHAQSRHQLVRLSIVGGYLDGQSFDFVVLPVPRAPMRQLSGEAVLEFTVGRWTP